MSYMDLVNEINECDLLVVGAGFFGLTIAERVANQLHKKVVVLEKRNHLGGNAYSYFDKDTGIEIHKYGSHLFHTSNLKVWDYVNKFTKFNAYHHRVFSMFENQVFSLPVNLLTLSQIYGRHYSPSEAMSLIEGYRNKSIRDLDNLEQKAISLVGPKIYDTLIKGYTQKQWGLDPRKLPPEIITRLPLRYDFNNRYFNDTWEGLPLDGYGRWFENIIKSKNISVHLQTDYFEVKNEVAIPTIYTGPLDRYFNYCDGKLSWRTLDFEFEFHKTRDYQGTAVMNYADLSVAFTRIHEFKHLHPERTTTDSTVIAKEFSRRAETGDEPYYPINSFADRSVLLSYRQRAKQEQRSQIYFGGRLGTYKYLDMHMAISSALTLFENELVDLLK